MLFNEYRNLVKEITIGKQLPDSIYLHKSAIDSLPQELLQYIKTVTTEHNLTTKQWDIVKLFKRDFKLSLLHYPNFFDESYPSLCISYTIDLDRSSLRKSNYAKSPNPPILHRKETFIKPDHPSYKEFHEITLEGEKAGLYENARSIGFKQSWAKVIKSKGYELVKGRLVIAGNGKSSQSSSSVAHNIHRHLTAIDRNSLSSPMQSLFRHNYFEGKYSILDYGCGKGDDIRILADHEIEVVGWDPVYFPENKLKPKDIVNLGFVINVIENIKERNATLTKAYKLAKKILVVSAMLGGDSIRNNFQQLSDGVITSRNTFQKYYAQQELRSYIEQVLDESPIAVGPGIFYVFKDKMEEQNFLVERERVKRNWQKLSYTIHPEKLKIKQRALYERHKELLEDFWNHSLDLGRIPSNTEFEFTERLRAICGSHQRAFSLLISLHEKDVFDSAVQARRDDLLVYLALELFGRRKPYYAMPEGLKRDIKSFFVNYRSARDEAKELLFSAGKTSIIQEACDKWYSQNKIGVMNEGHSLVLHKSLLDKLPAILRIYIGCATQLYGDIDSVDLVKIHMTSGKVSLMRYDDFDGKPLPMLLQRIKIKLRHQDVDFFTYGDEFPPQPLYLKSQYITNDYYNFKKQKSFDNKLMKLKGLDLSGYGPSRDEFNANLNKIGLAIRGYYFYKIANLP